MSERLNRNQKLAITGVVLGAFALGGAQLTDIFGTGVSKIVVSVSVLGNTILNGILALFTKDSRVVEDASNVKGVEPIRINTEASPSLAAVAMSDTVPNVGAVSAKTEAVLEQKANGGL